MGRMQDRAALIGIDWGTTSFRAYRIGADGRVIETKTAPAGILEVEGGAFEAVLERELGSWLAAAPVPVLASGDDRLAPGLIGALLHHLPGRQRRAGGQAQASRHRRRANASLRARPLDRRCRRRAGRDPRRGDPDHRRNREEQRGDRRRAFLLPGTTASGSTSTVTGSSGLRPS